MMKDRVRCEQPIIVVSHLVERIGIHVKGGERQKITGPPSLSSNNATDSVGTTRENHRQLLIATGRLSTVSPMHEVLTLNTVQALANLTTSRAGVVSIDNMTDTFGAHTMHGALTVVNDELT